MQHRTKSIGKLCTRAAPHLVAQLHKQRDQLEHRTSEMRIRMASCDTQLEVQQRSS